MEGEDRLRRARANLLEEARKGEDEKGGKGNKGKKHGKGRIMNTGKERKKREYMKMRKLARECH